MNCEYCKKEFSSKSNLKSHQKTAGYCLELQGKNDRNFECEFCNKKFTQNQTLIDHSISCKEKKEKFYIDKIEEIKKKYEQKLSEKEKQISKMEEMLSEKDKMIMDIVFLKSKEYVKDGDDKGKELSQIDKKEDFDVQILKDKNDEIKSKDKRIKMLENKFLSKHPRSEYPEKNVIYLLTTKDHLERRTYILGKAKDLKSRLSTYNKTCDHEVVYYKGCKTEEDMSLSEILIMNKLGKYREQANRERFILPEDKDTSFFISEINTAIEFINSKYNQAQ
jgi:hypothetical protein